MFKDIFSKFFVLINKILNLIKEFLNFFIPIFFLIDAILNP